MYRNTTSSEWEERQIKYLIRKKTDGTITVFLSLILILILSLLVTIVEGARVNTTKIFTERALSTAMDSVLARYYGPLWEEYHIFGYYHQNSQTQIPLEIQKYMQYTLQPSFELDEKKIGDSYQFYKADINRINITNTTKLTDYQGELFVNEAVEYMKYKELGKGMEFILNKFSLLDSPKQISYVYEKKQELEEKIVEMDTNILQLMKLLDGLKTSKNGIVLTKKGKLSSNEYFVKKILLTKPSSKEVEINHNEVFLAVKDHYINPNERITTIQNKLDQLIKRIKDEEELNKNLSVLLQEINLKKGYLNQLQTDGSKTKEIAIQITTLKNEISKLEQSKKGSEKELKNLKKEKTKIISEIEKEEGKLKDLFDKVKPFINDAIACINHLINKAEVAAPLLKEYKKYLYGQRNSMDESTFQGLEENAKELEKYIELGENHYDFKKMKSILEDNLNIMISLQQLAKQARDNRSKQNVVECKTNYSSMVGVIKQYKIKGLRMDYSSLVIDKSSKQDPIKEINSLLKKGIVSLLMDPDTISDGKLDNVTLPSDIVSLSSTKTDIITQFKNFFKSASGDKNPSGLGNVFNSLGMNADISSVLSKSINGVAERLLYLEYLKEHFYNYKYDVVKGSQKPSVLNYELEYFTEGKTKDIDNLSSVVMKITLLRTIMDFATIISDSTKRNEARALAVGIVGFTGLPILVGVIQTIILLIWSFAEALLDVCAMLMGKEVPIIKKKASLSLPEIFMINRSFLQKKASSFPKTKEISLLYTDYLYIFLLVKGKEALASHAMDLVQENLKIRYHQYDFSMERCLYGFEVAADFTLPSNFTSISPVQGIFTNSKKGLPYKLSMAYSY